MVVVSLLTRYEPNRYLFDWNHRRQCILLTNAYTCRGLLGTATIRPMSDCSDNRTKKYETSKTSLFARPVVFLVVPGHYASEDLAGLHLLSPHSPSLPLAPIVGSAC